MRKDIRHSLVDDFSLAIQLSSNASLPIYSLILNLFLSYQLPIPATYILDTEGIIHYSFVEVDHTVRLDPELMLHELAKI